MDIRTPFAVISPDTHTDAYDIAGAMSGQRWFERSLVRLGLSFRRVAGTWEGKPETSYIVLIEDENQRPALYRLAKAFKQDAVLEVDANGYAALFDSDGNFLQNSGKWQEITAQETTNLPAYTYADGRYFAAI